MKQITFRDLLNLMYYNKAPKRIKYNGGVFQKYGNVDYRNTINMEFLSSVIGEDFTAELMAWRKVITIYDEILDDKEKEYLSNVIKPFKKCVKYITKIEAEGREKILICYKDFFDMKNDNEMRMEYTFIWLPTDYTFIWLPTFKKGTMYRGMELNKEYTVEELGL